MSQCVTTVDLNGQPKILWVIVYRFRLCDVCIFRGSIWECVIHVPE